MPDESAFRTSRLCVVGNINRDIKTAPIAAGPHLFADGETSIQGVHETIGGGGANSAAAAAALGATCHFVGQVGDDALGQRLETTLRNAGVHPHLHRAAGVTTGTTVNLVYQDGHRHFLSCLPNNYSLTFESLDLSALSQVDHLYRADVWFSESMLFGGNRKLFEAARHAGVATSIDLNWDPAWGTQPSAVIQQRKAAVRELLPLVDLVHGNARELIEFMGTADVHSAVAGILESGAGAVILHMGAQGAGYFSGQEFLMEPPAPIARQVMMTGTGDVLSVCMMLLHGSPDWPAGTSLRLANRIVAEFIEGRRHLLPDIAS